MRVVSDDPRFRIDAPPPARRRFWWIEHPLVHLVLFLLTLASTTVAGAIFFGGGSPLSRTWPTGLRFSIPVIVIMGTHEMGHYLMCRRYGISATLPFFMPAPTLFGTFGALIRIKEPIRKKTVLLDVGAAGPIAGFCATIPFLFYSIGRSTPVAEAPTPGTWLFGYPLLVRFAQDWTGIARFSSASVHEDPTFMAAWFGMLVTCFNLLPIGQLDGGHVLRAAVGRRQPAVSLGVLALAVLSTLKGGIAWAIWASVASLLVGIPHPATEDEEEPLGTGRLTIALVCLAVFLLCVTLVPIAVTD